MDNDIIQMQAHIVKLFKHVCTRCGHLWVPNKIRPVACPRCHSPYWNKKRQRISLKLYKEMEKLNTDEEVQKILKKMGIMDAEFFTKNRLAERKKHVENWHKYNSEDYKPKLN